MTQKRFASDIVNLTGRDIRVYEDFSGCIWKFPSEESSMPSAFYSHDEGTYYVVDRRLLDILVRCGRPLDDIAIIKHKGVGRKGKIVSYLVWAEDEDVPVRLRSYN